MSEGYIIRGSGRGERDMVRAGERGASLCSLTLHGTPNANPVVSVIT